MIQWEYLTRAKHLTLREADLMGADGWELCAIAEGDCMWFKRRIDDKN